MPDPNLPMLEDAARKLAPFLDEIVFAGGVTLGLLITDEAAAPIRATTDVDVSAEIATYAEYIVLSERLRRPEVSVHHRLVDFHAQPQEVETRSVPISSCMKILRNI